MSKTAHHTDGQGYVTQRIQSLKEEGYDQSFRFVDGVLMDGDGNQIQKSDVKHIDEYRFEGMSNPADLSILFAIELTNGARGTLLAAYGPNADPALMEFFADKA